VLSDGAASYMQGAGGLIGETRGGTSKYYHADALGTTRAITNSSQTKTDSLDTDAFGMSVAVTGTTPTPFGFAGQHGYQNDSVTGLMRLGHRFYDASVGRFLSRDPIQDGYNWYTYCNNDPVNGVDPSGLENHDKDNPGHVVNNSKKFIPIVWDDGDGHVVMAPLPPGWESNDDPNSKGSIDVDFIPGGSKKWRHILPERYVDTVIDANGDNNAPRYVPRLKPPRIEDRDVNDDPNYPDWPDQMGIGSKGRKPKILTWQEAEEKGYIYPKGSHKKTK